VGPTAALSEDTKIAFKMINARARR